MFSFHLNSPLLKSTCIGKVSPFVLPNACNPSGSAIYPTSIRAPRQVHDVITKYSRIKYQLASARSFDIEKLLSRDKSQCHRPEIEFLGAFKDATTSTIASFQLSQPERVVICLSPSSLLLVSDRARNCYFNLSQPLSVFSYLSAWSASFSPSALSAHCQLSEQRTLSAL